MRTKHRNGLLLKYQKKMKVVAVRFERLRPHLKATYPLHGDPLHLPI